MNYTTINALAKASFIEKRSEFIGYLCPVSTNDEAVNFINNIKAEHRKAKHNVYAYILRDNNITRYSDDGEPQGTAGIPVLDVLQKHQLIDICCVVTRYFGGILLGGGGLVRAYSHCASLAVNEADILNMYFCNTAIITMDYDLYGKINYILPEFETKLISSDFGNNVKITVNVKSELYDSFCKKLTDITSGKILIEKTNELFDNF